MNKPIMILASEEMQALAKRVHDKLNDERFTIAEVNFIKFANNEIKTKIPVTIRHMDVYLFHSLYHPNPNESLIKLLLTIDAVSRASVESITLVLPYISYTRQDRKDEPRVSISARLIADLLQVSSKVERIITIDLHSDQTQGFYKIPVDNLYGALIHREYFKKKHNGDYSNVVVVSPDHGGVVRARRFAKLLDENVPVYIFDKIRTGINQVEVVNFIGGDLTGKDVIIYDDMIDTGGSIISAAKAVKERGAKKVYACATHGLFSKKREESVEEKFSEAEVSIVITESIPRTHEFYEKNKKWLTVLQIDDLLVRALKESSTIGGSVSSLFEVRR